MIGLHIAAAAFSRMRCACKASVLQVNEAKLRLDVLGNQPARPMEFAGRFA